MDVITVGNANPQEAVLAIKILLNFDSAKELITQLSLKLYLFAMNIGS